MQIQQLQQDQQDKQQQQETKPPPLQLTRSRFASLLDGEHAVIDVEALRRDAELETGKVLFVMKRQKRKASLLFAISRIPSTEQPILIKSARSVQSPLGSKSA